MTSAPAQSASTTLSKAEVGLHGGLPNGWQYGIAGDYAVLGNGDGLGLEDVEYQRFRAMVHSPAWRAAAMLLPGFTSMERAQP